MGKQLHNVPIVIKGNNK